MIKFLRVFDAEAVLSKRSSFHAPIVIKQDLTKEERLIESILLRERWNLVQNGTDRKFIKIRNTDICDRILENLPFGHKQKLRNLK